MRGLTNTSGEVQTASHAPAATTAAVVTIAAIAGEFRTLLGLVYSYDTASVDLKTITIVSGATTHTIRIRNDAGPFPIVFPNAIRGEVGATLVITLAAPTGGSGSLLVQYQ